MPSEANAEAMILAANCRLREQDPGPDQVEIGTATERRTISRVDFWRDSYTRTLVAETDAEITAVLLAQQELEGDLAGVITSEHLRPAAPRFETVACALDLCDRAIKVIRDAGADRDDATRRRLVAAMRREDIVETLGAVPGVEDRANRLYAKRLAEIDGDESRDS